jgi:hypothetical protein
VVIATELEAARKLAEALSERAEEAEIRRREQAKAAIELKRQRTVVELDQQRIMH